jgi:Na+/proline symporter
MTDTNSSLAMWSWIFLAFYVVIMLGLGIVGMRRVKSGDDFAVARASYGPIFLAFAIVATSASGGTFLGLPAMAYEAAVVCVCLSIGDLFRLLGFFKNCQASG